MLWVLLKTMPKYLNESLLVSRAPPTLKAGMFNPCEFEFTPSDIAILGLGTVSEKESRHHFAESEELKVVT